MPLYRAIYQHPDRRPSGITFTADSASAATIWAERICQPGSRLLTVLPSQRRMGSVSALLAEWERQLPLTV